ncbi:MAG: HIT domain-containing protein [Planctomycetota bacterium]|nr:HIT domain-containing protein [Planctomycetota bacterium]
MQNKQLWAPWRLGYIKSGTPKNSTPEEALDWLEGADQDCFLCRCVADLDDRHTLTVQRGAYSIVVLNRYPYNNGHLLIAPRTHKARLDDLSVAEHSEIMQTMAGLTSVLERLVSCDGFNIGLNLGRVAGAGVPGHLHWHMVPRWAGDTNFMPVLADTHVISQSLESLYDLLHEVLAQPSPTA